MLRSALIAGSMLLAATAQAGSDGWLVRSSIENPTPATLSVALGTDVASVEHVVDNLYKVMLAPETELLISASALRERALTQESGVITGLQPNFTYKIALEKPAFDPIDFDFGDFIDDLIAEAGEDNPAIQPPNGSPARGPDPRAGGQWGLSKVNAQQAWNVTRGNRDVVVAVIDTGVDYNHEDLRNAMWRNPNEIAGNGVDDDQNGYIDDIVGWDFAGNDALPYDKMSDMRIDGNPGHGTHCAGVVGSVGNNAIGTSGVAPNVSIMALRFITEKGEGTTADAVKAIRYAVANGAKVLSNSWGGEKDSEPDTELRQAIQDAQSAGVLLIFASGNGRNGVGYNNDTDAKPVVPASYDYDVIVAVAATDSNDALGAFSNFGVTTTDLAAPGVTVLSTVPNNGYEDKITVFGIPFADWSGTSMATPHVAGAAALVWSKNPSLTNLEVKAKLLGTARAVSGLSGKVKTGGVLDAAAAVQ